ncbi:unnamed protein product, partial [Choristocarpus tenellus]
LYPEWALASLPHVPSDLTSAVVSALMEINSTHSAAQAGGYSTWDPPLSYSSVR